MEYSQARVGDTVQTEDKLFTGTITHLINFNSCIYIQWTNVPAWDAASIMRYSPKDYATFINIRAERLKRNV